MESHKRWLRVIDIFVCFDKTCAPDRAPRLQSLHFYQEYVHLCTPLWAWMPCRFAPIFKKILAKCFSKEKKYTETYRCCKFGSAVPRNESHFTHTHTQSKDVYEVNFVNISSLARVQYSFKLLFHALYCTIWLVNDHCKRQLIKNVYLFMSNKCFDCEHKWLDMGIAKAHSFGFGLCVSERTRARKGEWLFHQMQEFHRCDRDFQLTRISHKVIWFENFKLHISRGTNQFLCCAQQSSGCRSRRRRLIPLIHWDGSQWLTNSHRNKSTV